MKFSVVPYRDFAGDTQNSRLGSIRHSGVTVPFGTGVIGYVAMLEIYLF